MMTTDDGLPRRALVLGAGSAVLGGLVAGCSTEAESSSVEPAEQNPTGEAVGDETDRVPSAVPFRRARQAGILEPVRSAGIVASFSATVPDAAALASVMQDLSSEVERLMEGGQPESLDPIRPPTDSGVLGDGFAGHGTAITVCVGASLFDERFGLGSLRPSELIEMPRFFNDRLVEPARSHGDIAVVITAESQQAAVHALHQVVRVTERRLQLAWVQEGFNQLLDPEPGQVAPSRNLMGFRDGTSNLDTADADEMDRFVWVQPADAEPDWAADGTYVAVRVIRMLIEFWATAALVRQEQIFGRHRDTGAPLGQTAEADEPTFASDQTDRNVPVSSHMRRANPRSGDSGRILRRGFSYLNGADGSGRLDQGLLFLSIQRSMRRGFLEVQSRLDGEPLEDYIRPVGGGFFFALPGPGDQGWLGQQLLAPDA